MKPQERVRTREYPHHPVPRTARNLPHIAGHFHAEGERQQAGGMHTGQSGSRPVNGHDIAAELTRCLLPWARAVVLT